MRPIGVVEAHEPVEFGGQLRILDRVYKMEKKNKLTPGLPKGFKDRYSFELELKKKIVTKIFFCQIFILKYFT